MPRAKQGGARRDGGSDDRQAAVAFGPDGETVRIERPETVKVLYEPLRFQMLAHLDVPRSVKEVAERIGEPVGRLYHHIRVLEDHGLIVVADERKVHSNAERLYRRAAERFELSGSLASLPRPGTLDRTLAAALERIESGLKAGSSGRIERPFQQHVDERAARLP